MIPSPLKLSERVPDGLVAGLLAAILIRSFVKGLCRGAARVGGGWGFSSWRSRAWCSPAQEKDSVLTFSPVVVAAGFALPPGISSLLPFVLIPVIFYFLLMRPNQKKQQTWQEMLGNLKPGDRVTTTGGIRGTIISLRDDALYLRVQPDGVKLEVVKSAIASVTTYEVSK
jgi:preprotein translocase subunit YajC